MSSADVQTPAFQRITANNHGPVVVVVSIILFVITVIVLFTRLITRFQITRKFSLDDYLISGATILAIGQTAATIVAVNHGLGRHRSALSDSKFDEFAKVSVAQRLSSYCN